MGLLAATRSGSAPKVCVVSEAVTPFVGDSTDLYVFRLVNRLAAKGLELTVIARQTEPPSPATQRIGNVFIRRLRPAGLLKGKGWKAVGPMLLFVTKVVYVLIKYSGRYDVILVCGSKILPFPATLAAIVRRKRLVIRNESSMELQEEISEASLTKMGLSRISALPVLLRSLRVPTIKRADRLVAMSAEIEQQYIEIGVSRRKIRRVPIGVDTDLFRPVSREEKLKIRAKLALPTEKTIINYTGRLVRSKGLPLLFNLWKEMVREFSDTHLLLVGTGDRSFDSCEDELLDFISKHGLEQSVSMPGEVGNVHEYLQASDVFVFPSEYEGFGMAIVEALACGLTAVVTRVGVARELITNGENGILIEPNDPEGLRQGLKWAMANKELWASMGLRARESVLEGYAAEVEVNQYLDMFDELVAET